MRARVLGFCLFLCATGALAGGLPDEWTFDEGTGDVAKGTKGSEGKITGATWTEGKRGKALSFQGPDYSGPYKPPGTLVEIAASGGLNPRSKVEVAASVFPTSNPVAWGGIVEKGEGYGASYRLLILRNGKARAAIGNEHVTVDSPEPLKLNAWTDLKLVFDGTKLKLFVNGKAVAETLAAPKSLACEQPIAIGRRFSGKIDDVRISY